MRLSASSPFRNCTSGDLFINWPRIVHIRLPRQLDPSSGTYIQKTRYQLVYDRTSRQLALLSGSYIRKVVHQPVQDHTHQDASLYHRHRTSGRLHISLSRITHNRTPRTIIAITLRLIARFARPTAPLIFIILLTPYYSDATYIHQVRPPRSRYG